MSSTCCATTLNARLAEERRIREAASARDASRAGAVPQVRAPVGGGGNAAQPTSFIKPVDTVAPGGGLDLARALQANLRVPG